MAESKNENQKTFPFKRFVNGSHSPKKRDIYFQSYESSDVKKRVLCKGLNFSVKPNLTEHSEILLPFQLLFRDVKEVENNSISIICKKQFLRNATSHLKISPELNITYIHQF